MPSVLPISTPDRTRLLAFALAVPALILALPGTLAFDPLPLSTSAGWAALALFPAAVLLPFLSLRSLPAPALLFAAPCLIAVAALVSDRGTDGFEERRALLLLVVSGVALLGGTLLSTRALTLFGDLLVGTSILFTGQGVLGAVFAGAEGAAGPLGNTGALSQAALPGAILGATQLLSPAPARRAVGALAAVSFAVHAGLAPVLAGMAAFAVGLLAWAALGPRGSRAPRLAIASLALVGPATLLAAPLSGGEDPDQPAAAIVGDTGGVAVRRLLWQRVPSLVFATPWLGAGPGQFQAAFPPHRDPAEIELSTHGRAAIAGTEVEHAHSDWLEAFAEYGLVGGGALVLLFVLALVFSATSLSSGSLPVGAAVIAVLANATVHCPLLANPAAAIPTWALLGVLLARARPVGVRFGLGTWSAALAGIALVTSVPSALALREHGELLARRQRLAAEFGPRLGEVRAASKRDHSWLEEGRLLRAALDVAPDSPLALTLHALRRGAMVRGASGGRRDARDAWGAVLAVRPFQVSALVNAGLHSDSPAERRALWEEAMWIDPGHPVVRENLARLELFEGSARIALEHIDALGTHASKEFLAELGARAILAGRATLGLELIARADPELIDLEAYSPSELLTLAKLARELDELRADALTCAAHTRWGLEHLSGGDAVHAITQFRQAVRFSKIHTGDGDPLTRLLLVASLQLADRTDEAEEELASIRMRDDDWAALPDNAREALEGLGVAAP